MIRFGSLVLGLKKHTAGSLIPSRKDGHFVPIAFLPFQ